jgi:hypothetical protein
MFFCESSGAAAEMGFAFDQFERGFCQCVPIPRAPAFDETAAFAWHASPGGFIDEFREHACLVPQDGNAASEGFQDAVGAAGPDIRGDEDVCTPIVRWQLRSVDMALIPDEGVPPKAGRGIVPGSPEHDDLKGFAPLANMQPQISRDIEGVIALRPFHVEDAYLRFSWLDFSFGGESPQVHPIVDDCAGRVGQASMDLPLLRRETALIDDVVREVVPDEPSHCVPRADQWNEMEIGEQGIVLGVGNPQSLDDADASPAAAPKLLKVPRPVNHQNGIERIFAQIMSDIDPPGLQAGGEVPSECRGPSSLHLWEDADAAAARYVGAVHEIGFIL